MDNNITIQNEDIELAQSICNTISNDEVRNRAVANIVASQIASRFFDSDTYEIDTESGLHNIDKILKDIDISDIYINGSYIDVRVYFSDDEMSIPKIHYNFGLTPVAYMFIKLSSDLSYGSISGFMYPENVDKNNCDNEFYYINSEELVSFYDVESRLSKVLDVFDSSNEKLYELLDGTLNNNDKIQLLKELIASKRARMSLIKAAKAEVLFNFVSLTDVQAEKDIISESAPIPLERQDYNANSEEDNLDNLFESEDESNIDEDTLFNSLEYTTEVTPSNSEIIKNTDYDINESDTEIGNSEQIDNLFTGEQEGIPVKTKKQGQSGMLKVLIALLIFAGCGYLLYTNTLGKKSEDNFISQDMSSDIINEEAALPVVQKNTAEEAMPNENVNVQDTINNKEDASSVAIPAIEQHLDASVLVSNLKVDWEVPAGYVSNTSAKRYLVKLGKIIQLNLKSELLLLNRPPIANKISVELKFNSNTSKFEIVGIKESSGEKTVDDTILQTIKSALAMNISSNIDSFGKLSGNPVLIIHL